MDTVDRGCALGVVLAWMKELPVAPVPVVEAVTKGDDEVKVPVAKPPVLTGLMVPVQAAPCGQQAG